MFVFTVYLLFLVFVIMVSTLVYEYVYFMFFSSDFQVNTLFVFFFRRDPTLRDVERVSVKYNVSEDTFTGSEN